MKQIQIIRSNRTTIAVEIKRDLSIVVRAPIRMSQDKIDKFILEKSSWIKKHYDIVKKRNQMAKDGQTEVLSVRQKNELKRQALSIIPSRVYYLAQAVGVSYKRIALRFQSTRWGSCSVKGNLNFNCLLALCPNDVIDYVIIHELCHLRYMNHSKAFWIMVEKHCPNYKNHKKWLKDNGYVLINRLRG